MGIFGEKAFRSVARHQNDVSVLCLSINNQHDTKEVTGILTGPKILGS